MAENDEKKNEQQQTAQPAQQPTQAEQERNIPYSRFQEVNEAKKALEARIAQIEAAQHEADEKRLAEQNQYKELAEKRGQDLVKAQQDAAKVPVYEETLSEVLAAQVAELPEDKRGLVPDDLTTQQKLKWIAKNASILKAPQPFDIGAGHQGGGAPAKKVELTAEQKQIAQRFGMTEAEYAKNI